MVELWSCKCDMNYSRTTSQYLRVHDVVWHQALSILGAHEVWQQLNVSRRTMTLEHSVAVLSIKVSHFSYP
jgi:hypothetical protein